MTAPKRPFVPKRGWIDQAPLVASTMPTGVSREVEILGPPDAFDYIEVRPIGQVPLSVHKRWLRSNPLKGY